MNKIFLVFVSLALYNDLLSYRKNKKYKVVRSMSEFLWYDNIVNSLEKRGEKVIIADKKDFWNLYKKYKSNNLIILVDHNRAVDVALYGRHHGCNTPKKYIVWGGGRDIQMIKDFNISLKMEKLFY